jgi:hypothetical protein
VPACACLLLPQPRNSCCEWGWRGSLESGERAKKAIYTTVHDARASPHSVVLLQHPHATNASHFSRHL